MANRKNTNQRTEEAEKTYETEPVMKVETEPEVSSVVDVGVTGTVDSCNKLNVRASASTKSRILCVLNKGKKVTVYPSQSKAAFYRVSVAPNIEGYCMKKYINIEA